MWPLWKRTFLYSCWHTGELQPASFIRSKVSYNLLGNGRNPLDINHLEGLGHQLNLLLLVANLASTKWCKKTEKWLKPWHIGICLRVLSEGYSMNTNMRAVRCFSKILWTKVASEGLYRIHWNATKKNMYIWWSDCTKFAKAGSRETITIIDF